MGITQGLRTGGLRVLGMERWSGKEKPHRGGCGIGEYWPTHNRTTPKEMLSIFKRGLDDLG